MVATATKRGKKMVYIISIVVTILFVFAFYYLGKNNNRGDVRLIFLVSLMTMVAVYRSLTQLEVNPGVLFILALVSLLAWLVGVNKSENVTVPRV